MLSFTFYWHDIYVFPLGLVGILFPNHSELAYSVHRIWQSIGFVMGFVSAQLLSLRGRCYVTLVAIVVALVSDLVLEFKTQTRETLLPWFLRSMKYSVSLKDKHEKIGNVI